VASPQDDQNAARRREAARRYNAELAGAGVPVIIRARNVQATPEEQAALATGTMPPSLRAQLDRQDAEDAVIGAMEDAERESC
jgi:hypothetical protein